MPIECVSGVYLSFPILGVYSAFPPFFRHPSFVVDMDNAEYIVNHVFMPLQLPQMDEQSDGDYSKDHALATLIAECATHYSTAACQATEGNTPSADWPAIVKMLLGIAKDHGSSDYTAACIIDRFAEMQHRGGRVGSHAILPFLTLSTDTMALLVRKQNAGIVFRVAEDLITCEVFEVSAPNTTVMACESKLVWTFPGPTTSFPRTTFESLTFQRELSSFIARMNCNELPGSAPHTWKAGSSPVERRDTAHPRYISDLLLSVLAALGGEKNPIVNAAHRVQKRIADDVLWNDALAPWRRSSLWLVIRVAVQTTLKHLWEYKAFMLYAMADIALRLVKDPALECSTLDNIRKKLARRASKLDSLDKEIPSFVFEKTKVACTAITDELTCRWDVIQITDAPTYESVWAPQAIDLVADTQLRLGHSSAYIQRALTETPEMSTSSFHQPNHSPRLLSCTIDNVIMNSKLDGFITSDDAYTNLADFEDMVCDSLSTWTDTQKTNSSTPSALQILIKDYTKFAKKHYKGNAEQQSLMVLTILDLWVALDRIVIAQLPLLADYPPEVPLTLLQALLLRRPKELARLKALHLYLSTRWDRSSSPSVFTEPSSSSFAVRHYDETLQLKARRTKIEEKAGRQKRKKEEELDEQNRLYAKRQREYDDAVHHEDCGYMYCHKCATKVCPFLIRTQTSLKL